MYLCDDSPKTDCPKGSLVTYRDQRRAMMGIGDGSTAAPMSLRALAHGETTSPLHRKVQAACAGFVIDFHCQS